jgi:hypothetical protein
VPATNVSVSVAESATTELCPATAIVAKLSDAVPPPDTVAHVLSPLRYVVASLVPDEPNLKTGTVPDVSCVALSAVRFAPEAIGRVAGNAVKLTPLMAGNVSGKRAAGIVPDARFVAFSEVKFIPLIAGNVAGKRASGIVPDVSCVALNAVNEDPAPENPVAVITPLSLIDAVLVCILVPEVPL